MIKHFLDKIFKLPPIEDRPNLYQNWRRVLVKFFPLPRLTAQKDDLYIYFQVFSTVAIVCLLFSLILFSTFIFGKDVDLLLFKVNIHPVDNLYKIIIQYNMIVSNIALWGVYPFFMIKFFWNINPKKFDLAAYNYKLDDNQLGRNRWKILFLYSLSGLGGWILIHCPYYLVKGFGLGLYYSESIVSAIFYFALISWSICIGLTIMFVATLFIYRYVGPYEGR